MKTDDIGPILSSRMIFLFLGQLTGNHNPICSPNSSFAMSPDIHRFQGVPAHGPWRQFRHRQESPAWVVKNVQRQLLDCSAAGPWAVGAAGRGPAGAARQWAWPSSAAQLGPPCSGQLGKAVPFLCPGEDGSRRRKSTPLAPSLVRIGPL